MPAGKLFMPEQNRTVKESRIETDEMIINEIDDVLIVTPKDQIENVYFSALNEFTEDFFADGRCQPPMQERMNI